MTDEHILYLTSSGIVFAANPNLNSSSTYTWRKSDMESTPLLEIHPRGLKQRTGPFLSGNIDVHYAYLQLLVCCFLTGFIDAATYNAWNVFMGMQTGNTIFLALSSAKLPSGSDSLKWARSSVSILSFIFGSAIAGRVSNLTGFTKRLTLMTSFFVQALCIAIAAILVQSDTVPERFATDEIVLIAIPFLAAQSGAQVATAKSLGFSELPTTVLTSSYNDIASDTQLLAWANPKRNRRIASVLLMLLGGISASWLVRGTGYFSTVLWVGAVVKMLLSISWMAFTSKDGV